MQSKNERKTKAKRAMLIGKIEHFSRAELFALWVLKNVGTAAFFLALILWTAAWISWNLLVPAPERFDPPPGFVLWLFISNLVEITLLPLVIWGQNLEARQVEARTEADFAIDRQKGMKVERVLASLERRGDLILSILARVEARKRSAHGS